MTAQTPPNLPPSTDAGSLVIVGNPNVGKSALFNRLTGHYVTVSNYPGTTVEITTAHSRHFGREVPVIDTPGMYSLVPITEEERVARSVLSSGQIRAVVHVIDAKNIDRMLGLTLQLIETGLPVVLALNMADEARRAGVSIDTEALGRRLGIACVATVSTTGEGLDALVQAIRSAGRSALPLSYGSVIEDGLREIAGLLEPHPPLSVRSRALLLLQGDTLEQEDVRRTLTEAHATHVFQIVADTKRRLGRSPHYYVTLALRTHVGQLLAECMTVSRRRKHPVAVRLDRLCMSPWTGYPLLGLVLYLGLYKFVGQFGAGTLVDWLDAHIFEHALVPGFRSWSERAIPWVPIRTLIAGDYGIVTLGLRYAIAIVLPIVGAFFLMFSVLEDSGYLPRLAMMVDRTFKRIGLNGRAVIPIVLGFGCDTMATLVTRTLESRRERLICTLLLALAIPCSAQLGVLMGLLSGRPVALGVWALVVSAVFMVSGWLAARLMPGERPLFYMELPPLRWPSPVNVAIKTYSRMVWYFLEILPVFLLASVLIWLGQLSGLFDATIRALKPVVRALSLPDDTAVAFLFGFFRRDYGAAGLYDLQKTGALNGNQLTVAAITLTLFLPCVAQLVVMYRERGWRFTAAVTLTVLVVALGTGWLTAQALQGIGVTL